MHYLRGLPRIWVKFECLLSKSCLWAGPMIHTLSNLSIIKTCLQSYTINLRQYFWFYDSKTDMANINLGVLQTYLIPHINKNYFVLPYYRRLISLLWRNLEAFVFKVGISLLISTFAMWIVYNFHLDRK